MEKKLKEGTTDALDVIMDIMETGEFENNRLAAAKVVLEKSLGSNYKLFENDGEVEDNETIYLALNEVYYLGEEGFISEVCITSCFLSSNIFFF